MCFTFLRLFSVSLESILCCRCKSSRYISISHSKLRRHTISLYISNRAIYPGSQLETERDFSLLAVLSLVCTKLTCDTCSTVELIRVSSPVDICVHSEFQCCCALFCSKYKSFILCTLQVPEIAFYSFPVKCMMLLQKLFKSTKIGQQTYGWSII
jgi:hypothetical protein